MTIATPTRPPATPVTFQAPLQRFDGDGGWWYIECPLDVEAVFGSRSGVRITGTFNGIQADRALIVRRDAPHMVVINGDMRRKGGMLLGELIVVVCQRDDRPLEAVIPEELHVAFEIDPEAKEVFDRQTPGMRRGMCLWVDQAKREETRANRAAELLRRLTAPDFTFGGQQGKTAKKRR